MLRNLQKAPRSLRQELLQLTISSLESDAYSADCGVGNVNRFANQVVRPDRMGEISEAAVTQSKYLEFVILRDLALVSFEQHLLEVVSKSVLLGLVVSYPPDELVAVEQVSEGAMVSAQM